MKIDQALDVKGLVCPIPVLKTKQLISKMQSGQILEISATDPAAKEDIPAWANRSGHELLELTEENNYIKFYLRKK
jgi:tRNA 2-thiouridine synthesizing protein A|tara:strand:- start:62 stop:289 length:228 start_codon:yes stop_codon:yes gene_type:complete